MKFPQLFLGLIFVLNCPFLLSPGHAEIIIDNFSESGGGGYGLRSTFFGLQDNKIAQEFNTGGRDLQLNRVAVQIIRSNAASQAADFTAEIWTSTNSTPDSYVGDLTLINNPTGSGYQRYDFRANNISLSGQTNYFFAIKDNASDFSAIAGSVFNSNNYTGFGSILENVQLQASSGSNWTTFGSNAIVIQAIGTPEPNSLLLIGMSSIALLANRRRRR